MKVLIPVVKREGNMVVPEALEDATGFFVYNSKDTSLEEFDVKEKRTDKNTMTIFDIISASGIDGLVTGHIRPAAHNRFREMGVNLYRPNSFKLDDIVDAIRSDSLLYAEHPSVSEVTGCMGSCTSCVSTCESS